MDGNNVPTQPRAQLSSGPLSPPILLHAQQSQQPLQQQQQQTPPPIPMARTKIIYGTAGNGQPQYQPTAHRLLQAQQSPQPEPAQEEIYF